MIVDYHMHLRDLEGRIDHTLQAIDRFVETAAQRGVDEIGFTEHVYYFVETREIWELAYQRDHCTFELGPYCDAVLEAKSRGLPVKLGLEVDFVAGRQERLAELLDPYPWDYLLGSVHWLDGEPVDMEPGLWAHASVEEVWRRYVEALIELVQSDSVDVLAHPDLVKIFGRRPEAGILTRLHEDAAGAIAKAGVCIEISTAGLRKPVRELYPDRALLEACVRRGVGITLASDAHEPGLVGEDFDHALAIALSAGCETVTVFEARRSRQEPLG